MPALVRIESLGPSFNTLAADDKYSRRNMQNFQQQLQTALSQKQKIFSGIFIAFIKPTVNLEHFDQKMWVSEFQYFPKYWLRKRWLLERPKRLASEDLSAINVFRSSWFRQCLELVNTLIAERCSEARRFERSSNHLLRSQ